MTREYGKYNILKMVCAGPKQYAIKMKNKRTGEIGYVQKVRGEHF